ncbi:MAG: methyltransferase domain-containing protein, partial [Chloroflexota bacterium]
MTNDLRSDLREAYNKKARERDGQAAQDWKLAERRQFLELLIQEGKKKLLEIGGGTGNDSLYFQEQGLEVVCTDLSPEMVKLCK